MPIYKGQALQACRICSKGDKPLRLSGFLFVAKRTMRPDKIVFFAAGMRQNNANNSQRPTILAKKVRGIVSALWQKYVSD
jgi:hypothetical protein